MSVDTNAVLMAYLLSDSALNHATTGVDERIYCPRMRAGFVPSVRCLSFKRRGGSMDPATPLQTRSYEFRCYGPTEVDAEAVCGLLYGALVGDTSSPASVATVQAALRSAGILIAMEETGPQDLVDVDGEGGGWPFVLAFFEVMFVG